MTRRYAVYLGLIALLVLINIGRWLLYSGQSQPEAREKTFLPEDFRLRVDIPDAGGTGRNLFLVQGGYSRPEAQGGTPKGTAAHPKPVATAISAPPPAQVESESAMGKLRLLGVVFHGGKRQAYLALEKESVIAAAGDTVFRQYSVEKIVVDAVELRDMKSNATRKIPVSGK